jgi:ArsR family transcriptional regulator, lead/cadmium/zinc/bismuth-responsive transcriptional repressor
MFIDTYASKLTASIWFASTCSLWYSITKNSCMYVQVCIRKREKVCMEALSGRTQLIESSAKFTDVDMCQKKAIHVEQVQAVRQNLLTAATAGRLATLFGVLSDPTRLQVVYALLHAPAGELCVCDLAAGLGRDDTTISHQLRVLRNQQIVTMRKAGRVVYYRLVDEHVRLLLELGLTHASELPVLSVQREAQVSA